MESGSPVAAPLLVSDMMLLRAASFGIRAPITVDGESSGSSPRDGSTGDFYNGSDDGLESGDDGTGNVFESAFENDPHEKIVQETRFLEVYALSKPPIVDPGENIAKEGNDRYRFSRSSVNESIRIRVRKQQDSEWSDDGSEIGDELVENEDHSSLNGCSHRPLASVADEDLLENRHRSPEAYLVSSFRESQAPIARISCDIDVDSLDSEGFEEEEEEEATSSSLRVPSNEVMEGLDSAPKVQTSDANSDVDNSESESEAVERMEFDTANSRVSLVAEKIVDQHQDTTEVLEEVPESDTVEGFGEHMNLNKHSDSSDLPSNTSGICDSAVEVAELFSSIYTETKNLEIERELAIDCSDDGLSNFKEAERSEQLLTFVQSPIHGVVEDHFVNGCIHEPVFEEIRGSLSIHDTEDLFSNAPFVDTSSIVLATRIIAEAMSPRMLVPHSVNGRASRNEEEKERLHKLDRICDLPSVVYHSPKDNMASEALQWLKMAEARSLFKASNFDFENTTFIAPEAHEKHGVEISLSILVIGKTGVGKSATINSIFGENKTRVDAFEPATDHVLEVTGMISGVKLSIFDTPGLRTSSKDNRLNRKILSSISKVIDKSKPDVVLYVNRLDMPTDYHDDLILMRSITSHLGPEIWTKSVVVLTHASAEHPEGPNGFHLSNEEFVSQRSQSLRKLITEFGNSNGNLSAVPVFLVENHFSNLKGCEEMVPHWRSELLDLCYITKTLSKVHSLVGTENGSQFPSLLLPAPENVHSKPSDRFRRMLCNDISLIRRSKTDYQFSVGKLPMINISLAMNEEPGGEFPLKIRHFDQLQLAALAMLLVAKSQTKND